ncbi:efflux RND transporter permease subunit [Nitrosomonas sp.]|uniref:efflux RND transporter permease subunit n=1 Tax=Nitrosomonas sp. TaxID=42353 RepID=UPI0033062574
MKLIIWFIRNPVAANLLMILIIVGGIVGLITADRYVYPPEPRHQLQITTVYDGAGPGEVEQAICIPIEHAVHDLQGVRHLHAEAQQSLCRVLVEFDPAVDATRLQAEVQARLEAVTVFPRDADKPVIRELKTGPPAIVVTVRGMADLRTLQHYRDRLHIRLSTHPDIGQILLFPEIPYEVSIEITREDLRRYGLSFDEIAETIRAASGNISAGELKNSDGRLLIRSQAQAMTVEDFATIRLRSDQQGMQLKLGDIARITEIVREQNILIKSDGLPAVEMVIWPRNQLGTTVKAVNQVIAAYRLELPSSVEVITWDDFSKYYDENMSMLRGNAISGFILIFIVLALVLDIRLALWVSAGILISVFGAFWWIPILGISLNVYTITALILILSVVVDDAIIVGEHIHRLQQQGQSGIFGAIGGVRAMAPLVVPMVLTTMIAFTPGLLLPGLTGHLLYNISAVAILALLFSMTETLLILPAHLAGQSIKDPAIAGIMPGFVVCAIATLKEQVDSGLRWLTGFYVCILRVALQWRYIVIAGFTIALLLIAALVISGRITSVLDRPVDDYYLVGMLKFPAGTAFEEIDRQALRLERIANEIRAQLNQKYYRDDFAENGDSVRHVLMFSNDNVAVVNLELAIDDHIRNQVDDIKQQWQERFGPLPAGTTLTIQSFWPRDLGVSTEGAPKAIEWVLTAPDTVVQNAAGVILKHKLAAYAGVHSVTSSMQPGKPELHLELKPAAAFHGLTMRDLSEQVRHGFFGLEVQRYYHEHDEIRVMLRFPREDRQTLEQLQNMPIRLPDGSSVPFDTIARAKYQPGFASIQRTDRERIQLIGAEVYQDQADVESILADMRVHVIPQLKAQFPGLDIKPGESRQKQEEVMSDLWLYGILALFGMYALLAIPLRSYTQPLIIMLTIPFGFIGAVVGHLLFQIPLSLESYFALFAVSGIVINDSLVLIAQINKNLQQKMPVIKAAIVAGKLRFRAILLMNVTTLAGLLPQLSSQGYDAEKIMPMAVTIAFGMLFTFFVTLFLVPAVCVIFNKNTQSSQQLNACKIYL